MVSLYTMLFLYYTTLYWLSGIFVSYFCSSNELNRIYIWILVLFLKPPQTLNHLIYADVFFSQVCSACMHLAFQYPLLHLGSISEFQTGLSELSENGRAKNKFIRKDPLNRVRKIQGFKRYKTKSSGDSSCRKVFVLAK